MEVVHAQFLQRYNFGAHCTRFGAKYAKWEPLVTALVTSPYVFASEL